MEDIFYIVATTKILIKLFFEWLYKFIRHIIGTV